MQEYTLFSIIKQWSSGPNAGSTTAEVDEQLLTLIGEIRLEHIMAEHLNSILDDSWLHQVVLQSLAIWLQSCRYQVLCLRLDVVENTSMAYQVVTETC